MAAGRCACAREGPAELLARSGRLEAARGYAIEVLRQDERNARAELERVDAEHSALSARMTASEEAALEAASGPMPALMVIDEKVGARSGLDIARAVVLYRDTGAIARSLGASDARIANAQEVRDATGYSIGGVSPFDLPELLDVLMDESLERFDVVYTAAGTPSSPSPRSSRMCSPLVTVHRDPAVARVPPAWDNTSKSFMGRTSCTEPGFATAPRHKTDNLA